MFRLMTKESVDNYIMIRQVNHGGGTVMVIRQVNHGAEVQCGYNDPGR